ncbi:hypothetical protein EDB19DRAFT_1720873 [Suillus lakei]|nr:hypothetical protein EDB19DRAFT_1720873 [Suillus lakei]
MGSLVLSAFSRQTLLLLCPSVAYLLEKSCRYMSQMHYDPSPAAYFHAQTRMRMKTKTQGNPLNLIHIHGAWRNHTPSWTGGRPFL